MNIGHGRAPRRGGMGVAMLLGMGAGLMGLATIATAAKPQQPADPKADPKPFQAFAKVCGDCHDRDRIVGNRRTKTSWEEVIDKMVSKGAVGSDEEFSLVEDYLLRTYGLVYVNRAPAAEMISILGISSQEADAIVTYRKEKGEFKDFDALAKVPGLDADKLGRSKDALVF